MLIVTSNRIMKFIFLCFFSLATTFLFSQQSQDVVLYDQDGTLLDFKELTNNGSSKVVVFW